MSFDQIAKRRFLEIPPLGVINCHAGALPRYRGRNVINWAIANGEESLGITVHYVDEGIDTGDIILQQMVGLSTKDTYAEALELAYEACPQLLVKSLREIQSGKVNSFPQSKLGVGFYCGRRRDGDEWINWMWPSERIFNFVRAISEPGPGARFAIEDRLFSCHRAEMVDGVPEYIGNEGEVVGRDDRGVVVKTGTSVIHLNICNVCGTSDDKFVPTWNIGTRLIGQDKYRLRNLEKAMAISARTVP
jgi:methionyl-tRNA formyltransferase